MELQQSVATQFKVKHMVQSWLWLLTNERVLAESPQSGRLSEMTRNQYSSVFLTNKAHLTRDQDPRRHVASEWKRHAAVHSSAGVVCTLRS